MSNYTALFKLTIGSHFFTVSQPVSRIRQLLSHLSSRYTVTQYANNSQSKREKPEDKVFIVKNHNHTEYRFHIGQLEVFKELLHQHSVSSDLYTTAYKEAFTSAIIPLELKEGWALKDYQQPIHQFILDDLKDDNHSRLISMPTGSGKSQPEYALIKVPGGWDSMGNMAIGKPVIAKDGTIATVTQIHPQGSLEVYRIMFFDGRHADCSLDHLWEVYVGNADKYTLLTTADVLRMINTDDYRGQLYVDLCTSEQNDDISLPVDPYRLGLSIETSPGEIFPSYYLKGSTEQRLALLQGILDKHGELRSDGCVFFSSCSQQLVTQVQYLVRSLGGIATGMQLSQHKRGLFIRHRQLKDLFRAVDKRAYCFNDPSLRLRIESVDYIGNEECQCISIDHPSGLYITSNFTVTHNTFTSLSTIPVFKTRTIVAILPTYIDQWVESIQKTLTVTSKEIAVIQGSAMLKGLIALGLENQLNVKFVIVSIKTLQIYYKSYQADPQGTIEEYGCHPEDLCKVLQAGTLLIDEVHQHIHAVFTMLTYTHVDRVIALSATLISNDPTIKRMHQCMFPREVRYDKVPLDQYTKVYAISYSFKDYQSAKIRTTEWGSNTYSHIAFEKSIMKRLGILERYLALVNEILRVSYLADYQTGDKAIIFAASVDMCDRIVAYLKHHHTHLDIRRYTQKDPYANVIESDIRVTTIISAGTAVDIAQLTTAIQTNNILSPVANIQSLGRLRKIKDRDVKYYYIYAEQIPKHVEYHHRRREMFAERVASIKDLHYPVLL